MPHWCYCPFSKLKGLHSIPLCHLAAKILILSQLATAFSHCQVIGSPLVPISSLILLLGGYFVHCMARFRSRGCHRAESISEILDFAQVGIADPFSRSALVYPYLKDQPRRAHLSACIRSDWHNGSKPPSNDEPQ